MLNLCVQRFLPSEFGHDVDRADPVEPGLDMYKAKRRIRRLLEEYGVPHTYICCNSIASWPYYDNTHPSEVVPPLDQFQIYGDGSVKGKRDTCNSSMLPRILLINTTGPTTRLLLLLLLPNPC